VMYWSEKQ